MTNIDVALVLMPYGVIETPSMALGQLTGGLKSAGICAQGFYANIWFAEKIGSHVYNEILGRASRQIGEWTFSKAAFPLFDSDAEAFLDLIPNLSHPLDRDAILKVRPKVQEFIDEAANRILQHNPRIIGCSSLFQQNCASLALLRKIKTIDSNIVTVMGGGVFDGAVARVVCKHFPWVDFAFTGEADLLFPDFCRTLLEKDGNIDIDELPLGVVSSRTFSSSDDAFSLQKAPVVIVRDMNSVPYPDFDDYFLALNNSSLNNEIPFRYITFETSRGCWWHEKTKGGCTFCTMSPVKGVFRSKRPERVMDELKTLRDRYLLNWFGVADDDFDIRYYDTLLPLLEKVEDPYEIFIQMRVTSSEERIRSLADAHILHAFVGIESLHDRVLRMMNKGATTLGNIALLKFSLENGLDVFWNFLHSVPGEQGKWYEEMAEWLPMLVHLQAPDVMLPITMYRNSRFHREPETYGLTLIPSSSHRYIYPLPEEELHEIAFWLEEKKGDEKGSQVAEEVSSVLEIVNQWQKLFYCSRQKKARPLLQFYSENDTTHITDTRPCAVASVFTLRGIQHLVHTACRKPVTRDSLVRQIVDDALIKPEKDAVEEAIDFLCANRLALQINKRILALATLPPRRPLMTVHEMLGGL